MFTLIKHIFTPYVQINGHTMFEEIFSPEKLNISIQLGECHQIVFTHELLLCSFFQTNLRNPLHLSNEGKSVKNQQKNNEKGVKKIKLIRLKLTIIQGVISNLYGYYKFQISSTEAVFVQRGRQASPKNLSAKLSFSFRSTSLVLFSSTWQTWKKLQARNHCLRTIFEKIVDIFG